MAADVNVNIDIDNIVRVFGGQPLKKLLVSFVDRMSIYRLQQIVKAFPELEDLMLIAADPDANPFWEGSIVRLINFSR